MISRPQFAHAESVGFVGPLPEIPSSQDPVLVYRSSLAHRSPRGSQKKKPRTLGCALESLQFTVALFGAFGLRVEEQRFCAEEDRAEARSTMAFWILDLVWRTLMEGYGGSMLCALWVRRGCHHSRETLVCRINRVDYMGSEMLQIAAVSIRCKAHRQKLLSCLALRASCIR